MNIPDTCSGIILAGGLNTRFAGQPKALANVGGQRIIDYLVPLFQSVFHDVILVTNTPEDFLEWDALIVGDLFELRSSLTGIHTGLFYMRRPFGFFTACDTPFLNRQVIETILARIDPDVDVVMPQTRKGLEPLCAAYSKRCLEPVENALRLGKCKIQRALRKRRTRLVSEKALRPHDPQLLSFFNINTPQDLEHAAKIINTKDAS